MKCVFQNMLSYDRFVNRVNLGVNICWTWLNIGLELVDLVNVGLDFVECKCWYV